MAMSFCAVSERWAYAIGRSHHDRHGRTDVRRGLSDRSGGIALTMSWCLANGTFVICSNRTKNITTKLAHTCHCTRMHRSPAPSRPSVRRWPYPSWAGFTTNTYECEFPTRTPMPAFGSATRHVAEVPRRHRVPLPRTLPSGVVLFVSRSRTCRSLVFLRRRECRRRVLNLS
jgi:hypothetical protein